MIPQTSYFSVLVRHLDVSLPTGCYKHAQKLKSLLTLIMATVYKPLPGKHLAQLKLSTFLCRHRPSLTVCIVIELYLLSCGRKYADLLPGSITIIVYLHKKSFRSLRGGGDLKSQVEETTTGRKSSLWLLALQHEYSCTGSKLCLCPMALRAHGAKSRPWCIIS